MFAICLQSAIPVRSEPSHRSEMISQLLFGELCSIVEDKNDWCKINSVYDDYSGYVEKNSLRLLSQEEYEKICQSEKRLISRVFQIIRTSDNQKIIVPFGSIVYDNEVARLLKLEYNFYEHKLPSIKNKDFISRQFKNLLNLPYLWGGKTPMGYDCSGFVQVVFRFLDIWLPRDASMQANIGEEVKNFNKIKPLDLAFFGNDKITHVGIILSSNKIIHCSIKLKIDELTQEGIFSSEYNKYTHKLLLVKRLV